MIRHNLRLFASLIIGLAIVIYLILFFATQDPNSTGVLKMLKLISAAISINLIVWMLFIFLIWRWKIFYPWLVQVPNLSGQWEGVINSSYEGSDPITFDATIKQSFFHISIHLKTEESQSITISSSFNVDKERNLHQLIYTYQNDPKVAVQDRSAIHYGSAILNFVGYKVNVLEGHYWTSRETKGDITLTRKNVT